MQLSGGGIVNAACVAIGSVTLSSAFLFAQTFEESENFRNGNIPATSGWSDPNTVAAISKVHSVSGLQSLQISEGSEGVFVERQYKSSSDGVTFVDFHIRPSVNLDEPVVTVDVNGALIGFISDSENQADIVCAIADERSDSEDLRIPKRVEIDGTGEAQEWVRLTIRQDFQKGAWDLFVDGELSAANLPLLKGGASSRPRLRFYAGKTPIYVDDVLIGAENPLFPDADRDGMSDAYEKATRLNPFFNDRDADRDSDGIQNVIEAVAGSRPDVAGVTDRRIIYVDNLVGSDFNSGASVNREAGGAGPKRSLKEAMRCAKTGDIVMILRGAGPYYEGSDPLPGGDFTIMFEDETTVLNFK